MIHLATGIALREGRLLLVASRYPNHLEPLWNLPGGRQLPGELLEQTIVREALEETSLAVAAREVAYVSESYDGDEHFLNVTFLLDEAGDVIRVPSEDPESGEGDESQGHGNSEGDHVVAAEWVPVSEIGERITIAVVREPLVAFLGGELVRRYAGFHDAGVTIEWPADSQ